MDEELDRIVSRQEQLERELDVLRRQRAKLERSVRPGRAERSLRDVMIDLLAESEVPLNSLLIASMMQALYGRTVPSTRFGTLSIDEQKSYCSNRVRPVYLCHCLTYDEGVAVKRFWARSDWPLQDRLIGPMTGRVLFLKSAIWTIEIARDRTGTNDDKLSFIAADHARSAGLRVERGSFQFDEWITALNVQLHKHLPADVAVRSEAAALLEKRLNEHDKLFGSRGRLVSIPGTTKRWKDAYE
jgi:hypothetical protein